MYNVLYHRTFDMRLMLMRSSNKVKTALKPCELKAIAFALINTGLLKFMTLSFTKMCSLFRGQTSVKQIFFLFVIDIICQPHQSSWQLLPSSAIWQEYDHKNI